MEKETYVFVFPNRQRATYWFRQTIYTFGREMLHLNRKLLWISFPDSEYYFCSEYETDWLKSVAHEAIIYPDDAIYIILDDKERFRHK